MVISTEDELARLKDIGRLCAQAMEMMAKALEPGITTRELDAIGRKFLEENGAQSAPETCYQFPGATCISVNEEVAHGIPGDRVIQAGDLVNIDVSAVKDGFFGDTGASYAVPPVSREIEKLAATAAGRFGPGCSRSRPASRFPASAMRSAPSPRRTAIR